MPVTAKLSKLFYERLGEQIANELVDWFNQVDATYRSDLRELNELNFARFDAKLEQRLAELDAKWGSRWSRLDAKLEQRLAQLDAKIDQSVAAVRGEIQTGLARQKVELTRQMFTFWLGTILPLGGLMVTLHLVLG